MGVVGTRYRWGSVLCVGQWSRRGGIVHGGTGVSWTSRVDLMVNRPVLDGGVRLLARALGVESEGYRGTGSEVSLNSSGAGASVRRYCRRKVCLRLVLLLIIIITTGPRARLLIVSHSKFMMVLRRPRLTTVL